MNKILTPELVEYPSVDTPQVFIGFDERQEKAYEVCRKSIIDNASGPVDVYPLNHRDLRAKDLFYREWIIDAETGNLRDGIDGLPFSNQFSHSRFLVPEYAKYLGIRESKALFVDLDFVFFDDIYKLFTFGSHHPVSCVKHNYDPDHKKKMDNQVQTQYPKKLWSSLMMFNLHDSRCRHWLNLEYVNTAKSSSLHRFEWVDNEAYIGTLPESWNFIPNHSEDNVDKIQAIHYTEGLPNLQGYESCKYSRYYLDIEREI